MEKNEKMDESRALAGLAFNLWILSRDVDSSVKGGIDVLLTELLQRAGFTVETLSVAELNSLQMEGLVYGFPKMQEYADFIGDLVEKLNESVGDQPDCSTSGKL